MTRRFLHRMELRAARCDRPAPPDVRIVPYCRGEHRSRIPAVYARAFDEPPWPADWDRFDEFDPRGMRVAEDAASGEPLGYVISFRRRDFGYVSVLAVVPEARRRGIGTALVGAAIHHLRQLGLERIRVDAFADSLPAVSLYLTVGFEIVSTVEDE